MKTGLSLVEMAQRIESQQAQKHDLIASTSKISVEPVGKDLILNVEGQGSYPMRPTAQRQVGEFTNIPATYFDRMAAEQPALLAQNVNTWLKAKPANRMVRTLAGNNRAFLSDRYQRIENEEIAAAALPVLLNTKGLVVRSCEVTERRLYIQASITLKTADIKVGDAVEAGVILTNSETGFGAAAVYGMIYRLACLNGMKRGDHFRRGHVGRQIEDNEALWADDTKQTDDKAILLKVRDMIGHVLSDGHFDKEVAKLRGLTEGKIEGSVEKAVKVLTQKIGATEAEGQGILRSLIEGHDLTRWGIVNAVTHQAHAIESYDRAFEFESAGGRLVDLPANDWKEILQAA